MVSVGGSLKATVDYILSLKDLRVMTLTFTVSDVIHHVTIRHAVAGFLFINTNHLLRTVAEILSLKHLGVMTSTNESSGHVATGLRIYCFLVGGPL